MVELAFAGLRWVLAWLSQCCWRRVRIARGAGWGCGGGAVGGVCEGAAAAGARMEHVGRAQRGDAGAAAGGAGDSCRDEAQLHAEWRCVSGRCADRAAGQGCGEGDAGAACVGRESIRAPTIEWKGHKWRVESAHDGDDLVMLVTPLESKHRRCRRRWCFGGLPLEPAGNCGDRGRGLIDAAGDGGLIPIYCTCDCTSAKPQRSQFAGRWALFRSRSDRACRRSARGNAAQLGGDSTTVIRTAESCVRAVALQLPGKTGPILDAIETTLGWDTIYEPEKQRVISPVSRVWSVGWGGYVLFDWDTFFAATMAGIGDKDLAYANALETLREETPQGFVPELRAGGELEELRIAPSRRWARSRCWGSTTSFTTAGLSRMRLSRC